MGKSDARSDVTVVAGRVVLTTRSASTGEFLCADHYTPEQAEAYGAALIEAAKQARDESQR